MNKSIHNGVSTQQEKDQPATTTPSHVEKTRFGIQIIYSVGDSGRTSPKGIKDAWDEEIVRRVEEIRAGKVDLVPWLDVVAQTRAKFG